MENKSLEEGGGDVQQVVLPPQSYFALLRVAKCGSKQKKAKAEQKRRDGHQQAGLRVNMLQGGCSPSPDSLLTQTVYTNQRRLLGSPVFADVCSSLLKIVGSSRGCGPERGGTPSKRRVY